MDRKNEHIIDKIARELLYNHSEVPPVASFSDINEKIKDQKKQKRRKIAFAIAASWAIVLAFGLGYLTRSFNTTTIIKTIVVHDGGTNRSINKKTSNQAEMATINNYKTLNKTNVLANHKTHNKNINNNTDKKNQYSSNSINASSVNTQSPDSTSLCSETDSLKLFYQYLTLSKQTSDSTNKKTQDQLLAFNDNQDFLNSSNNYNNKWIIGGGVSSMLGFNISGTSNEIPQTRMKTAVVEEPQSTSAVVTSISTGISVKRILNNNWKLRSGLNYNKITDQQKDITYIELPLMCEYTLLNKTVKISFANGLGAGLKQELIHPLGLSSICIQYPINKTIDINLEPSYKHIFGKSWIYKPDYYGVMAGMSISF